MRKEHMEKDLFHHVVLYLTGLTVEMSIKLTVTIAKKKKKEKLNKPPNPHERKKWKKSIDKDQGTKYFWLKENQLDEFYCDITVKESVCCSPLKYVVHISTYQHVLFRAKALFSPL